MIAQVVFDLPVDGHFDYLIPPHLENRVVKGRQVTVFFGPRKRKGIVVGLAGQSDFKNLKPIWNCTDADPLLDKFQLSLAEKISRYYGCSLGDALLTIARGCEGQEILKTVLKEAPSVITLHVLPSGNYESVLISLIRPLAAKKQRVLILTADQFAASAADRTLKKHYAKEDYVIGNRSLVFRSLADIGLVVMMDEDNASFRQEQTPMYDTRDVLLMRSKMENTDVAFVSTTPSVEMMHLVHQGKVVLKEHSSQEAVKPQIVDLNNYKILVKGILSPAVLSALEQNAARKQKSILVFNHRGSYAMTRCEECGFVLKCRRCESPVLYSRTKKQYLCRYCSFHLPPDTACPACKKPSWKSFGLGIEQLQKALQDKFISARIVTFERDSKEDLKDFDILIGTWALLRFKNQLHAELLAFLDIDSELNRLDMRSCFHAWSMVGHLRGMAGKQILIQSRQVDHYCIQSMAEDKREKFYHEDMKIRRELGFSPFAHQVAVHLRGAQPKQVEKTAQEIFDALIKIKPNQVEVHAPMPEVVANKRGQYRLNILLQGADVVGMITLIKQSLAAALKRRGKVIVTINVDP